MLVSDFDFDLPEALIALRPAVPRESARLLVVDPAVSSFQDRRVGELIDVFEPGDVLVFNDTRVIRARLRGRRHRGETSAAVEVMLHRRMEADSWLGFTRPARRVGQGETIHFEGAASESIDRMFSAAIAKKYAAGEVLLKFDRSGPKLDEAIAVYGTLPLPPYISGKRLADTQDNLDYQTIFAKHDGAVAAPTAGLHFTEAVIAAIRSKGVILAAITLHVGAGTFLPVKVLNTAEHTMHAEWAELGPETAEILNLARQSGRRIVAVGTTSLRVIESAANQEGYIRPFAAETRIFITPGYRFRAVDMLMTNFHLPKSTLFMLVSAFSGVNTMKRAYAHAIAEGYRFYSYGDCCLLSRSK